MPESKLGHASGLKIEAGNTAFTTTGTTVVVYTTLTYITSSIGVVRVTATNAGKDVASCPTGAVTSGKVTFTRTDATDACSLDYVLFGY
jgi:hypothetical protein